VGVSGDSLQRHRSLRILVGLLIFIFAFFLHLCGGIRHLIWDAGHGFELSAIYESGWLVVAASIVLTGATWIAALLMTS
jgi:succinate dehydrogenase / fumarate reductase cytochrome b subunit